MIPVHHECVEFGVAHGQCDQPHGAALPRGKILPAGQALVQDLGAFRIVGDAIYRRAHEGKAQISLARRLPSERFKNTLHVLEVIPA